MMLLGIIDLPIIVAVFLLYVDAEISKGGDTQSHLLP